MNPEIIECKQIFSLQDAHKVRDDILWDRLSQLQVRDALQVWYESLNRVTRINYQSGINILTNLNIINPEMNLQAFSLFNHDSVVDSIKNIPILKETTKQSRAALYISFTRFLSRRFPRIFVRASPSKEGTSKTFFRVHQKVVTEAMTQSQWLAFLDQLKKINYRDYLIAKIIIQGGKRVREVLSLTDDRINWNKREITFHQSKTMGLIAETVITYPESIMKELFEYMGERKGIVFISKNGKPLSLCQLANTFSLAGKKAKVAFKVTPHVLRASTVTYLKQQGFQDSDIQKITGHASSEMVNAYDKSSRADNATKKINLVV